MPLAALGVASQGLDAPLSAIMAAVQGLLPRDAQDVDVFSPQGILGAVRVRRRVRRWKSLASVPLPLDLLDETDQRNLAILLSEGCL